MTLMTQLRCDEIFKYEFAANLTLSLAAKEFWKLVNIWESYGHEFSVLFFWLTVYNRAAVRIIRDAGFNAERCVFFRQAALLVRGVH